MQTMKNGFLGTDEGKNFQTSYEKSKAVIIPFGYEGTVSYGGGTKKGPKAIIDASHQVETLDEQTMKNIYKCGICTLKEPKIGKNPKTAVEILSKLSAQVVKDGKFPVILGGEHSITQGSLQGVFSKYKNLSILHFDAHPDMREHYHGSEYSHASVFHQSMEKMPVKKIVQVGIRNMSDSNHELEWREKNQSRIKTFWGWENPSPEEVLNEIPDGEVFVSFDVDAFDPSIMPATGTPEPGGLLWWPVLNILKLVFEKRNVVGADIVELAPIKGLHHPDFLVARLVYKMIGFKFGKEI